MQANFGFETLDVLIWTRRKMPLNQRQEQVAAPDIVKKHYNTTAAWLMVRVSGTPIPYATGDGLLNAPRIPLPDRRLGAATA
jgi:hypothetical protein